MSTETVRLIREGGEGGKGIRRWGRGRLLYLSLHCHHRNDSCIKMSSDENHFNVSLIVRDKVTRPCPQTTILEVTGEPKQIRNEVPLLTSLPPYRWAKLAHADEVPSQIVCAVSVDVKQRLKKRTSCLLYTSPSPRDFG